MAAGTITVTTSEIRDAIGRATKYSVAWVSDGSGDVNGNTFDAKSGELIQANFIPDGGGTQPTDLYDVTLTDVNGVDVLGGEGANLSNTASKVAVPAVSTYFPRFLEAGALTPVVANAGNAKGGTIEIVVR